MKLEEFLDYVMDGALVICAIICSPLLVVIAPIALIGWIAQKLEVKIKSHTS